MNDEDQTLNKKEQLSMLSGIDGDGPLDPLWAYDDFTSDGGPPSSPTGLIGLRFITSAIRRATRLWCAAAVAGLLIGVGLFLMAPPAYQASASVFITHGPNAYPPTAITDDQVIAQSRTVARLAMRRLGLRENVDSFDAAYTVTTPSDRVLLITVNAPSTGAAVKRANALATAFLQYRAGLLEADQNLLLKSLGMQINQVKSQISSVSGQARQLPAQPRSSAGQAASRRLRTERAQAAAKLIALQGALSSTQASTATAAAVKGSQVLDAAAPSPQSRLDLLAVYAGTGLLLGLTLGIGSVIVWPLISDRPRDRDEIAHALDADVKLSVARVPLGRWLPARRGLAALDCPPVEAIATYLRGCLPAKTQGAAALAVVPADEPHAAALSLVALALSFAREGKQTVLVDLAHRAPAADLLGVKEPGIHTVTVRDERLTVAIPDPSDPLPAGPRHLETQSFGPIANAMTRAQSVPFAEAVAAAHASADVFLTLAALEPSLGGDHLPTWTSDAVVLVTAGRSSWTKIHAIGEMIRFAGVHLVSGVLVGADKTDESLGAAPAPHEHRPVRFQGT